MPPKVIDPFNIALSKCIKNRQDVKEMFAKLAHITPRQVDDLIIGILLPTPDIIDAAESMFPNVFRHGLYTAGAQPTPNPQPTPSWATGPLAAYEPLRILACIAAHSRGAKQRAAMIAFGREMARVNPPDLILWWCFPDGIPHP